MRTVFASVLIAPAIERPLPRRVAVSVKWIAPLAIIVPLKIEVPCISTSPFICQYTLHREAELTRITFDNELVAKAPPIWKINKALGSPCASKIKSPSNVAAAPWQ
jgi:hypothetical protein